MAVDGDNREAFKVQLREHVDDFIQNHMDFDMADSLNITDWWEQFYIHVESRVEN